MIFGDPEMSTWAPSFVSALIPFFQSTMRRAVVGKSFYFCTYFVAAALKMSQVVRNDSC